MEFMGSTELQDAALDKLKSQALDADEPEQEDLENFLWDFLEGAQANSEAQDMELAGVVAD